MVSSIPELADSVKTLVGDFNQIANTAYCSYRMLTNPSMALNVLSNIAMSMVEMATQMASTFASMFAHQIEMAMGQVLGTAVNFLTSICNILGAIDNLLYNLDALWNSIVKKAKEWDATSKSDEECEAMFAAMAACYLNKLIGDDINEFYTETCSAINELGSTLNSEIASTLSDTNTLTNYMNQEAFMINKMSAQVSYLNTTIYGL